MSVSQAGKVLKREPLIAILRAALQRGEYRFARQAALSWLASFPGDLEVTLLQAQAMIADGKPGQATAALERVSRADPLYPDAYRLLAAASQGVDPLRHTFAMASLFALSGANPGQAPLEPWALPLRHAFTSFAGQKYAEAEKYLRETQGHNPDLLLGAVLHLLLNRAQAETLAVYELAERYHARWPDCLPISLVLAESTLELGNEPDAVRLLHLCVSADTTGQAARRLWGRDHAYRSLWSEDLVIWFDQPIPAGVAASLGWNSLAPGPLPAAAPAVDPGPAASPPRSAAQAEWAAALTSEPPASGPQQGAATERPAAAELEPPADDLLAAEPVEYLVDAMPPEAAPEPLVEQETRPADVQEVAARANAAWQTRNDPDPAPANRPPNGRTHRPQRETSPAGHSATAQAVNGEFERLAKKLNQPALARADGRCPVYVILSSLENLNAQYGPQTTGVLDGELHKLAALIRQRSGWDALIFYPDDAAQSAVYGLAPVNTRDPWKIKNALADLDGILARRGEMIGALLIVGGDAVIPFHRLPNPTDDSDAEVISDSPYTTLDANYFVPEWPVGRLPGEKGPDAGLLLEQLRQILRSHARHKATGGFPGLDWILALQALFQRFAPVKRAPSFGYTAAVWRRSSLAVFRPIGAPHTVLASPPAHSGTVNREKIAASGLCYYNLHGLPDSPAWYGQRDPLEPGDAPDYPVALSPDDLKRNGQAPRVIFSEACYGGYIFGKAVNESLALKFLSLGSPVVVASTTIAYGSVNTPLIAADLLGNLFWQHLKAGRAAGEALMQARIDLVREMNRRQGFLDGEDQKTLISFVLYGDPLATYDGFRLTGKTLRRSKDHLAVKTVSDRAEEGVTPPKLSNEALQQVKQIVAEYLPGADLAAMHLVRQTAPAGDPSARRKSGPTANGRVVVTVSKQVQTGHYIHKHYVRVTLDEAGRPVKMSISR